jgi:arylsulfatase A-like enzyme/Tfp pilus assembly protein PilF
VIAVVAVALAAGAGYAWWRARAVDTRSTLSGFRPSPGDLNVLFITMDTTRADRLGCYGFAGASTPNIDALARDGVLFEHAAATVPLTFPSHSSIFTGLVPPRHGVRDNGGFFLDAARVTLAERLQDAGWATGAFVAAWVLESKWGLGQGFDEYSDRFQLSKYKVLSLGTVQKPGEEVAADAVRWIDGVKDRKFFAWVHLYDPHTPYDPPEPFASRHPGRPYLGEIEYTDFVVGKIFDALRERGLWDRTLVVLTGDHGESLGDHGESTHAYFIYESTMHVPLIVRTPWGLRGRVAAQVSSVDIMPTVLDLLGLAPQDGVDGRSLAGALLEPAAAAGSVAYSETYFTRYHFGWQHLRGLRDGRYSYIDAPEPELYDLAADPGETRNVFKSNSARAEPFRVRLETMARDAAGTAVERRALDPDTLQRLAALGYVGNVVDADPDAVLPDPKAKLPVFQSLSAAKDLAQQDKLEEAVARMRAVLAADPGIMDAQVTLGNWLTRLRRPDEAAAAFKAALTLKPDDDVALQNLAWVYMTRGRTRDALEALEVFRAALRVNPKNPQSWYQLATLYMDLGRTADAQAAFEEALRANPRMGAAYNGLGVLAFERGDLGRADELFTKVVALEPDLRTAHYNLARLREARQDDAQAEALYRKELEIYPDNGKARFNLAQLYRERGDRARYVAELEASIEHAPDFGPPYFFLAREHLDLGRLDSAAEIATRGLKMAAGSEIAPLGHYVLADVYNRQGRAADARSEVLRAQKLESALRRNPNKQG